MLIQFAVTEEALEDFDLSFQSLEALMWHTHYGKITKEGDKIIIDDKNSTATIEPISNEDLPREDWDEYYPYPLNDCDQVTHLITFNGSRGSLACSATTFLFEEMKRGFEFYDYYIVSHESGTPWVDWRDVDCLDNTTVPVLKTVSYINRFIKDSPHRQGVVYKQYEDFNEKMGEVLYNHLPKDLREEYYVERYKTQLWAYYFGTIPTQEQTWFEWVRLEENLENHITCNPDSVLEIYEQRNNKI